MKKSLALILIAVAIVSCKNDKKGAPAGNIPEAKTDSLLITDSSWGAIDATTDMTGLQNIFGVPNVQDERICGPECADSLDVTKVFPGKNNEIVVYWEDSAYHKKIAFLESYQEGSPYRTANGLKAGSTLNDILKINGQKITFSGFDWDYGGFIQSYNNGRLDSSPVNFRLEPRGNVGDSLSGDTELNTDMPVVKKALDSIAVYYITLSFYKH